jgi:hypothetical protein
MNTVEVAGKGPVVCLFDGPAQEGNLVVTSEKNNGDCHDAGTSSIEEARKRGLHPIAIVGKPYQENQHEVRLITVD